MHFFHSLRARWIPVFTVTAVAITLASCASTPGAPSAAQASGATTAGSAAYTGRLTLIVMDQNGAPLADASVDLRGTGKSFYRVSSTTRSDGRVSFDAVPPEVEASVVSQSGSFAQTVMVPQSGGTTEVRVTIQTFGGDSSQGDAAGQQGAAGR